MTEIAALRHNINFRGKSLRRVSEVLLSLALLQHSYAL